MSRMKNFKEHQSSEIIGNIFLIRSFCLLKIFRFHDFGMRAQGDGLSNNCNCMETCVTTFPVSYNFN